jgi:hypothetical protein
LWRRAFAASKPESRDSGVLSDGQPLLSTRLVTRDFLDSTESDETARRVNSLRDRWTRRSDGFFTLGAVSFLDATGSPDSYLAAAAQANSLLSTAFDDLYGSLLGFMAHVLDEPVGYGEDLALPGFQVFEFDGQPLGSRRLQDFQGLDLGEDSAAKRAHFDVQFLLAAPGLTPEATVSFTLPLQQPSGGAGLAFWSLDCAEAVQRNMSEADLVEFATRNAYERVGYQTGRMILHDGLLLHAAMGGGTAPKGQRITLQGHGIRRAGHWTLFW